MVGLATDFSGLGSSTMEIDRSPYSLLLTQILAVLASERLTQESAIKMVHRCNFSLFRLATADVQTTWLKKVCEMLPAAIQTLDRYKFGTFQLIVGMWRPIIELVDSGETQSD